MEFMACPQEKLKSRVYNVTAMSFTPEQLADCIAKHIPELKISYRPDSRQLIADDWPQVFDDSEARKDWGWKHDYDMDRLVVDILHQVQEQLNKKQK
jgi:threonine 3-dehydrogenase